MPATEFDAPASSPAPSPAASAALGGTPPPPPPPPSGPPPNDFAGPPRPGPGLSLAVTARADQRAYLGTAVVGVAFAVAAQNGLVTVSGFVLAIVTAIAVLASRRLPSRVSRVLLLGAPVLGLALLLRTSPWVIVPICVAMGLLVALSATFATTTSVRASFPQLGARLGLVVDHLMLAPGMLRADGPDESSVARARLVAIGRGVVLAVPVLLIVGGLLGMADPVFRSWFDPPRIAQNAVLIAVGGWVLLGILRAASATSPTVELRPGPRLGTVEVVSVLGSLGALYAMFVAAQVVAALGGADHVQATRGLTYADYAREGFFQLLIAASVTLIVLLGVRACADRTRLAVLLVSEVTIVLTMIVVGVAIRRLELYRDAFGLTPLRLASSVAAVWIGVVFVMVAIAVARRTRTGDWLAPAVVLSAVGFVAMWALVNPAAIVAGVNLDRAATGAQLDPTLIARLGADAVPTVDANLDHLAVEDRRVLRMTMCSDRNASSTGLATNLALNRASDAYESICAAGLDI